MKKILLIAAAAAVTLFASCSKEDNAPETGSLNVVVKIPNVQPVSRAIGPAGVTGAIATLTNGHIFIISPAGNIIQNHVLQVAQATSTGQVISDVPSDSKIFVLANIPTDIAASVINSTTLTALLDAKSNIFAQTEYTTPAMGNVNAAPVSITTTSTTEGTANVQIRPLYSRIELAQVKGGTNTDGDNVTGFTVTGVWVDAWHPEFTMAGLNAGTIYNQLTNTDFTGNTMGETGTWVATGTPGAMIAIPETGKVWYHHVPAGGLPRLIVRVEGVNYNLADGSSVDLSADAPYFITVKNYKLNNSDLGAFEAGRIYKIGGNAGLTFNAPDNIHVIPNPDDIKLTLTVEVIDWIIVTPDAELY